MEDDHNRLLLLRATDFAARKHRDQRRKGRRADPYINHPISVALILAETGDVKDPEILAAVILHDTVEDTDTTPQELEARFGARIRGYMEEVSDEKSLPRKVRKELQIQHASGLSAGAALIKLGDKISNVTDMVHDPPASWDLRRRSAYLDWAEAVGRRLPKVNTALEHRLFSLLRQGREKLSGRPARPKDTNPPATEPPA
jgi:guanosine-3',5'-bis(diphosphate) 3'-pyrophosphohydrolase